MPDGLLDFMMLGITTNEAAAIRLVVCCSFLGSWSWHQLERHVAVVEDKMSVYGQYEFISEGL